MVTQRLFGKILNAETKYGIFEETNSEYTVVLPDNLDTAGCLVPLIVALHFAGYKPPHYGRLIAEQLVAPAFSTLGAVILAPDCDSGTWASGSCYKTVIKLIGHLSDTLPIDPTRVVLTGYSLGGIGTWEIAARHPELFSAAIIMAGRPRPEMANVNWKLPLYVIHSRNDEVMPIGETENIVNRIRQRGGNIVFDVLENTAHSETFKFLGPLSSTQIWLKNCWN